MSKRETAMIVTNDHYWDCECKTKYIHLKTDRLFCQVCGACESDMPDSRQNEIDKLTMAIKGMTGAA